jgi:hypothetical protein
MLSNLTFDNHFNFKMALVNRLGTIVESDGNEKFESNTTLNKEQFYKEVKTKFEYPLGANRPMT